MRGNIRNASDFQRIIAKYFARQWLPGTSSNTFPSSYYDCKTRKSGRVPQAISQFLFSGSIDKLFLLDWQIILPPDILFWGNLSCPKGQVDLSMNWKIHGVMWSFHSHCSVIFLLFLQRITSKCSSDDSSHNPSGRGRKLGKLSGEFSDAITRFHWLLISFQKSFVPINAWRLWIRIGDWYNEEYRR